MSDSPASTTIDELNEFACELAANRENWKATNLAERLKLLEDCLGCLARNAKQWVALANEAKRLTPNQPSYDEDLGTGPVVVARNLRLLMQTHRELMESGSGPLAHRIGETVTGRVKLRVIPAAGVFDRLLSMGFQADVLMPPGVSAADIKQQLRLRSKALLSRPVKVAFVLGAGNVSSIPVTDTLHKLFCENQLVLLKMSPVNAYLGPVLRRVLAPLIDAGFVRIAYGGADVGSTGVQHESIDEVHITGGNQTHDRIVWGTNANQRQSNQQPELTKPITSELGNVTPWIIVPGRYSPRQLAYQAENVAVSIANNVSFNCIATKVIITASNWPQRRVFLDLVQARLQATSPRFAYYPGANERFARFTGKPVSENRELPWTLLEDVDRDESPLYFEEESFVPVCVETNFAADSPAEFLNAAVDFCNGRLWGTLSAAVTAPGSNGINDVEFQAALERLRYGTIALNQWPALAYLMAAPPWGGYPGATLEDVQSGIGWVHNTPMLPTAEKTIMTGPLVSFPYPPWFASHPKPQPVFWAMLDMLCKPSMWATTKFLVAAMRAPFYRSPA